jgi:hypothetical protein
MAKGSGSVAFLVALHREFVLIQPREQLQMVVKDHLSENWRYLRQAVEETDLCEGCARQRSVSRLRRFRLRRSGTLFMSRSRRRFRKSGKLACFQI